MGNEINEMRVQLEILGACLSRMGNFLGNEPTPLKFEEYQVLHKKLKKLLKTALKANKNAYDLSRNIP